MPIEPTLSVASAIHAAPGTIALLLGSGISRAAEIPTGWDVVIDLIRKVAAMTDGASPDDPVAWYAANVGGAANYSDLIAQLAPTPAGRRDLLDSYFTASEDDRAAGRRLPTRAHHAIAQLMTDGYVRVVITTNFDRLLETALRQRGVEPTVISSAAAAQGSTPLAHAKHVIVKVHGDYLDADIRNTIDELDAYDPRIDVLLDQVFDQYGLVVAGWSGDWDHALRAALMRCPTRRYGCWWAHVGQLSERAQDLVVHRGAVAIAVEGADQFFESIQAKVRALADLADRHPVTTAVAVAEVKRYLPDPSQRIRLHDLLMHEVNRLLSRPQLDTNSRPDAEAVLAEMRAFEADGVILQAVAATIAFFASEREHDRLLVAAVDNRRRRRIEGYTTWSNLELYPSLSMLYGVGLAALASGRLDSLVALVNAAPLAHPNGPEPFILAVSSWRVLDPGVCNTAVADSQSKHLFAVSEYVFGVMREPMRPILPDDDEYSAVFDDFEYLVGVIVASRNGRGPIGRFARSHRWQRERPFKSIVNDLGGELITGGVFNDQETLDAAVATFDTGIDQLPWF